ncbi:MAG: hypothetical protein ACFFEV_03670 [Candidatus Thorarchaeota archaeon]
MKKRVCVLGIVFILIAAVGVLYLLGREPPEEVFDSEGRYDSTVLNNMGVIYENQSDIYAWNNGYSESDACPWGYTHYGLDYIFLNNSNVIAAAPGLVETVHGEFRENETFYTVSVQIRFNSTVWINYSFEGFSLDPNVLAQQISMIDVEVGDWVAKGDVVGRFLQPTTLDHVDFTVYLEHVTDLPSCPRLVMGLADYNELMSLVHSYHPTWELCYP